MSRRSLLKAGALAGGGLLLGVSLDGRGATASATSVGALNAFIRIDLSGAVTMTMPSVEMGQGAYTSVAMLLAEELDVGLDQVTVEHAPTDAKDYANPAFRTQMTGGSTTIMAWYLPLRTAGARARSMLVEAAARRWSLPPSALTTKAGKVVHQASGRSLDYGALADAAARITLSGDPVLKASRDFTLIGTPAKRVDTPDKVNGKAVYGIDVMLPGMRFATFASSPVLGGKVRSVDSKVAAGLPGVTQIVVLDDMVAVVADHMWSAMKGLEALSIEWSPGAFASLDQDALWAGQERAALGKGVVAETHGDAPGNLVGEGLYETLFELPFLAHVAMEPMNCTVHVHDGQCEVWVGTQVMGKAQDVAAKEAGVDVARVTINNHLIGGGFGRRLEVDGIAKAVRIARHVEGPVKIVWSREEDVRQDYFRPLYHLRTRAKVEGGVVKAWHHRITGPSILARFLPAAVSKGVDVDAVDGAVETAYDFPNTLVEFVRAEIPAVPISFWRGVGPNANVFATEGMLDKIAHDLKVDPVVLRRRMVNAKPRARAVLELAVAKSAWSAPLPVAAAGLRTGRGIALMAAFGSFVATVAEVEVADDGEVWVRRLVVAADVGAIVNPDTLEAQMQGGSVFGLAAILHGEITIESGRVKQSNFHDYRVTRIDEMPTIECHMVRNDEKPGGIGEPATVAAQAAIANAVFAATGVQLSRMPINRALIARDAA
ncbi:molybdopterin cofactor-binding domain-containing protein [Sphingomonas sp. UYP23]